jgi:hypothetical protein
MLKTSIVLLAMSFSSPLFACADIRPATCPDASLGEIQEDCPWAGIARGLSLLAQSRELTPADLKAAAPDLYTQINRDSAQNQLKGLWGQSINYDELAKGIILDPAILKVLAKTFQVAWVSDRIAHAGVEHTYGYLFSTLKTAFGYKRARWVHGDTERGFGLPVGTLSPAAPSAGGSSLFSNATFFFGKIAFRNDPATLKVLVANSPGIPKALQNFGYSSLKTIRLEETITSKNVVLRTDMVPFTVKPSASDPNANQYLLVYSVVSNGLVQLITGFPVGQGFVDSTLNKDNLGDDKPIITRYNAFVDGISGNNFTGSRRVISAE